MRPDRDVGFSFHPSLAEIRHIFGNVFRRELGSVRAEQGD